MFYKGVKKMRTIKTYIVDAFTDVPFKGNPAGVCLVTEELSDSKMQGIAKELGLSETAFVRKEKEHFAIRYFSPKTEIPLCGHATLAAAKVLFEREVEMKFIHFVTVQKIDLNIYKEGDVIQMEFPVYETSPIDIPRELLDALGLQKNVNSVYNKETNIILVEIENVEILQNLKPDFEALIRAHDSINGVLVTALSNKKDFDFESRYFWPWNGTNEDPVTGGTHTFLTKYWAVRLHKKKMHSFQCSERSGFMEVELVSDSKLIIKSKAQIVFEGLFRV